MNKNYWPLGIFLFALVVVGLIVLTIKTAITNPVELQRMCQRSSQDVDENINEITKLQAEFLKKYVINFEGAREQTSKEFRQAFIRITSKENGTIQSNAKVNFYLTRPHTAREDRDLGKAEFVDGLWQSPSFSVESLGRYQIEAYVEIGKDSLCISKEYRIKQ
ncbi:hypothetical protein [Helicobacter apodemus]|uniref:YtkA-like domain-containing protein n=1 Tax=Helicobacter apodemus TaxID=135569 RepID=A0A2U8FEI5_9HELI|nr:hypothetical protein [Helicobacter apodemus]AWI34670.1 hypothetical protein CDV25_07760 [Helicobacter apodemus]